VIEKVFFLYCAFASVVSAGMMISRDNLLHGVLWMLTFFVHVAGIFLLLNAEFIAALQIMVYAGAILVLYLFLIMLLDIRGLAAQRQRHASAPVAGLLAGVMGALMLLVLTRADFDGTHGTATAAAIAQTGNVQSVAKGLFTTYLLPFEVASLILLVAMVGAVLLAKKRL
jgi:NADH-quinone oxidoreductase subunit J